MGQGAGTIRSSADITQPARQVEYQLDFLAPDDAFYIFAGYLGERRQLPGRDRPPGADYNTWPTLKPLPLQLVAGYWREGNAADLGRLLPLLDRDTNPDIAIAIAIAINMDGRCLKRHSGRLGRVSISFAPPTAAGRDGGGAVTSDGAAACCSIVASAR